MKAIIDKVRFIMNPNCILINGVKRGAIYDLTTGSVYSIDKSSVKILEMSKNCLSITQICIQMPQFQKSEIYEYFQKLVNKKIGFISDSENIYYNPPLLDYQPKLDFVWLELTSRCNLKCIHCYGECSSIELSNKSKELTHSEWKNILRQIKNEGCRQIQFIGGEPLSYGSKIIELIKLASDLNFEFIELFTNATLLSDQYIKICKKYNIQVGVSLYSKRSYIHDSISQTKGSFDKTINSIKKLKKNGIRFRVAAVIMKQNEKYLEETTEFIKILGGENALRTHDFVRPIGRIKKQDIISTTLDHWRLIKNPSFLKINKEIFTIRRNGNSCWSGKLCITPNGSIIPCVMARNEVMGNIRENDLNKILTSQKVCEYWGLSKDKIKICKDCEFRYACSDCRPLAKGYSDDLLKKADHCLYNPYSGGWELPKEGGEKYA